MSGLSVPSYTEGINLFLEYLTDTKMGAIKNIDEVQAIGFKTVMPKAIMESMNSQTM